MATTTALLMMTGVAAITINSGYGFTTIPGRHLMHVTTSTNYFWGVDTKEAMCKCLYNSKLCHVPVHLIQVDADDHEVWGVNRFCHVFKYPVDGSGVWRHVGGALTQVTTSGNGVSLQVQST